MSTILNAIYTPLIFIAVLTIVVFIHEMGHFLVARWCGVRVEAFSIGFGREIWGFTDKLGTRWKFSWIPLGGYVKFVDDENGASVPSRDALDRMTPEERSGAFQTKPLASRAAIVAAGPAFNIVSAVLILWGTFWLVGSYSTKPIVDSLEENRAAARAGLQSGDRVVSIDGASIQKFSDLQRIVSQSAGRPLDFVIDRQGRLFNVTIVPESREIVDPLCNKVTVGIIGVKRDSPPQLEVSSGTPAAAAGLRSGDHVLEVNGAPVRFASEVQKAIAGNPGKPVTLLLDRDGSRVRSTVTPEAKRIKVECKDADAGVVSGVQVGGHWDHQTYALLPALAEGVGETLHVTKSILWSIPELPSAMAKALTGQRQSQIGGPIAIAEMTDQASRGGLPSFLNWIAVFSIMLGIMNLLPIPLLDGGHLMFYAIEAVRGRPLDERKQELSFKIGMAILATMMFAAIVGDLMRKLGVG